MAEEVVQPELTAQDILAMYRPSADPIVIELPEGGVLRFKPITSTREKKNLENKILEFLQQIPEKGTPAFAQYPHRDVLPETPEERFISLYIHFRSLSPVIDQRTAFEYHRAPDLIEHIERKLGIADKNLFELQRKKAIEEAQKKSKTPGNEEGSPPLSEDSRGETPTT